MNELLFGARYVVCISIKHTTRPLTTTSTTLLLRRVTLFDTRLKIVSSVHGRVRHFIECEGQFNVCDVVSSMQCCCNVRCLICVQCDANEATRVL